MTTKKQQDALIAIGSNIKALGDGRIGGHLVLFGSPESKDLYGDYFTPETYFGPSDGDGRDVAVNHRMPFRTGDPMMDQELKTLSKRLLSGHLKTSRDAVGIFAEVVCDMSDDYERAIYQLAEQGKLKWSAGAAPHMVEREPDGQLKMFVISEGSLTPVPAEPRMLDHRVMPLKAYLDLINQPDSDSGGKGAAPGAPAGRKPAGSHPSNEVKTMDILAALKKLMPDLTPEQIDQIAAILGLTGMAVTTGDSARWTKPGARALDPAMKLVSELKSLGYRCSCRGESGGQDRRHPPGVRLQAGGSQAGRRRGHQEHQRGLHDALWAGRCLEAADHDRADRHRLPPEAVRAGKGVRQVPARRRARAGTG